MGYLNGNTGLLPDSDRFAHRVEQLISFLAHMRNIDTAILRGNFRQFYDFLCWCKTTWNIEKTGRDPQRTVAHCFGNHSLHALKLEQCRVSVVASDNRFANRALSNKNGPVWTNALGFDFGVVGRNRKRRTAVVALGKRSHALQKRTLRRGHIENAAQGVRVWVDKTRCHNQPCGIDNLRGLLVREITNRDNSVSANAHIGFIPRVTRAVDDAAVGDNSIEILSQRRRRKKQQRETEGAPRKEGD